jgi:hypothetical protein
MWHQLLSGRDPLGRGIASLPLGSISGEEEEKRRQSFKFYLTQDLAK